jgi:hypothetical protein
MSGNGCVNQFTPITPIIPSFSETYLITSLLDLNEKHLYGTALILAKSDIKRTVLEFKLSKLIL